MVISPNDLPSVMRDALTSKLQLDAVADVAGLFGGSSSEGTPRLLIAADSAKPLQLVVRDELELRCHGMIYDPRSGTIGLLQICRVESGDGRSPTRTLAQQIQHDVQQAVALRHWLLQLRDLKHRAPVVELVLVIPMDAPQAIQDVSDVLRNLMLETSFLHSIGTGLWQDRTGKGFGDPPNLYRAFPWLLHNVRIWYRSDTFLNSFRAGAEDRQACGNSQDWGPLRSVELRDFRLPGVRKWEIDDSAPLHLIHGHNGTGKSSFTEAVELMVTGRLERLDNRRDLQDYRQILTNRRVLASPDGNPDELRTAALIFQFGELKGDSGRLFHGTIDEEGVDIDDDEFSGTLRSLTDVISDETPGTVSDLGLDRKPLDAGAVRLEQNVADELVRSHPAKRAERFLRAFFPELKDELNRTQLAEQEYARVLERVRSRLPRPLRQQVGKPSAERVVQQLEWLDDFAGIPERIFNSSPLQAIAGSLSDIAGRLGIDLSLPSLGRKRKIKEEQIVAALTKWDTAWQQVVDRAEQDREPLEQALVALRQINRWRAGSKGAEGTHEQLVSLMSRWLDCHAKYDWGKRQLELMQLAQAAREQLPADELASIVWADAGTPADIPARQTFVEECDRERKELREQFLSFQLNDQEPDVEAGERPDVDYRVLATVDRFLSAGSSLRVGEHIRKSLESNDEVQVPNREDLRVTVGQPGGLDHVIRDLESRSGIYRHVLDVREQWSIPLAETYRELLAIYQAARERVAAGDVALKAFRKQLEHNGELANAVNELAALFTPAQWAYDDITGKLGSDDAAAEEAQGNANGGMSFDTSGVPAELLLNTAELNTLATTLFLLCAPTERNPLRMLLLDDPFQNMDELTVTTIARGISRLLNVWEETDLLHDWRMTILLHGEENLERLRRECHCQVYFLPWLTPENADDRQARNLKPPQIVVDAPRFEEGFSPLEDLFRLEASKENVS